MGPLVASWDGRQPVTVLLYYHRAELQLKAHVVSLPLLPWPGPACCCLLLARPCLLLAFLALLQPRSSRMSCESWAFMRVPKHSAQAHFPDYRPCYLQHVNGSAPMAGRGQEGG